MQSLPIVTFSVNRTIISEGEETPQVFTLQLNEPAPDDGLTVRLELEDPDGDLSDGGFPPQLFNNISDSDFIVENGNFIVQFTISPGATEASFGFLTGEDNRVEGDETYTLTLLDGESYSIDSASEPIVTTITEKSVINGTSNGELLFGTDISEFIVGKIGNDTIFGNGGEDNLIGNEGDDLIYGASQADTILGGEGNDTIFANGGGDLINSGTGEDTVWLGAGEATVIIETGEGFDTVNNFQLGATTFQVESKDNLSFVDSINGAKIFQGDDLLAVVSWQSANTFSDNQDSIFTVIS
ncbi:putative calcium-binding protein [Rivularia sp. PCC 7116]|uniref:calcium-binding protein n=1 Tax=Rivularia sp. PCC 7116 TaxID=373994 RepID=UPI00029EF099|nr:calcium-binding protein [Rivularia sp. PCC 7116]AFY58159.1 putative calcium-binding protein [Rivularia sp. PCC 7116]